MVFSFYNFFSTIYLSPCTDSLFTNTVFMFCNKIL